MGDSLAVLSPPKNIIVVVIFSSSPSCVTPCRDTVSRIFEGLENSTLPLMPVLSVDKPLFETMTLLAGTKASILPTSHRKIQQCKMLFDR